MRSRRCSSVSPDRTAAKDLNGWLDRVNPDFSFSHWAWHREDSWTPREGDKIVVLTRPMTEIVFSLWDYLKGPNWAGRLSPRDQREHVEQALHWRWHWLALGMVESESFSHFLSHIDGDGIPDLAKLEASMEADLVLDFTNPDSDARSKFEELTGREVHWLPYKVNDTPYTAWRGQWFDVIEDLIYEVINW